MSDLINSTDNRRHDVDWLRSLAFILLIFYHIGMYYVADWGWHVKSTYQSENLQYLMLLVNPWRMPLIFFISGFALCMVERKIKPLRLLKIRALRVLIPAIIGSNFIVVPQVYYEAVYAHNYQGGFITLFTAYFSSSTTLLPQMHHSALGLFTWNHLWYLVYLWHYTLIYLAIRPILIPLVDRYKSRRTNSALFLFALLIIFTAVETTLEPHFPKTHALIDDWYNHARYLLLFFAGYFVAKNRFLFESIIRNRKIWLTLVVPMAALSLTYHKGPWPEVSGPILSTLTVALLVGSALLWIFTLIGFAGAHLNQPSRLLNYMNNAVLPWYILHQTITIVIAMNIKPFALGPTLEPLVVIAGTFLGCALLYEIIRRFTVFRFMFGLKLR